MRRLVGWYEDLSHDELATLQVQLPFLSGPIDAAGAAGFRLSEVSLAGTCSCVRSGGHAGAGCGCAARRPAPHDGQLPRTLHAARHAPHRTTIRVTTSDPERHYELEVGDNVDRRRPAGRRRAPLPAEALLRLAAGRLAPGRGPAPRSPAPSRFGRAFPATDTPAHRCGGTTSRSSSMKMVKGSSAAVAASDPSNLGTSTKPKARTSPGRWS